MAVDEDLLRQGIAWTAHFQVSLQGLQRLTSALASAGSNLVVNPGFESAGNWSENTVAGFPGTSFYRGAWGTASPHGGTSAYVLSNHVYGILKTDYISVNANTEYDLYAWMRAELDVEDSGGSWILRAYFYDESGVPLSYQNVASGGAGTLTTWQQQGGRITTPSNAAKVRIQLYNYMNSGWIVFDDISLKQVGVYNLSYDAENRLVSVSGAATASFTYDGDSNRVKSVEGGVTTAYVGSHFEWKGSTSTVIRYYYAGSQRIAMRTGTGIQTTGLYFLFGDHLGSTSVSYNASTGEITRQLYMPWGSVRYSSGTLPTDYTFTGQKSDSYINLLWYNSRWYDSSLGRFTSPDTIVPLESQGVQAWDRFAYVNNSPLNFVDTSGHTMECGPDGIWCDDSISSEQKFGISFTGDNEGWTDARKAATIAGIELVAANLGAMMGKNPARAWAQVYGKMKFEWDNTCYECRDEEHNTQCGNDFTGDCAGGGGFTISGTHIKFASMTGEYLGHIDRMIKNVVHELGHAYDHQLELGPRNNMPASIYTHRDQILRPNVPEGRLNWQQNLSPDEVETFADMFIAWNFNAWNTAPENAVHVTEAQNWMNGWMP